MDQTILAEGDMMTIGAEDVIETASEEVVTSDSNVCLSTGPVTQVVTLQQTVRPAPAPALTNTLRNIRLIAIQPPKSPFNGLPIGNNGTAKTQQPLSPSTAVLLSRPASEEANQKMSVGSFYSSSRTQLHHTQPAVMRPAATAAVRTAIRTLTPIRPAAPSTPSAAAACKPTATVKPSPSYYKEQQRQQELKEYAHLNDELMRGVRILLDLTSSLHHNTTLPFMERVDALRDGAPDYDLIVDQPMWLNRIKDKFKAGQYDTIGQFAADLRQILVNCYRYNGPNHPVTKKGLRLEQSFEQKLALLPADLRDKCSLPEAKTCNGDADGGGDQATATAPANRTRKQTLGFFSHLLERVKDERQKREQAARDKRLEQQRQRREERERQRCLWAEQIMNPRVKAQMRLMWEIPQIGHFLHLAQKALHIGEIAQFELEHMFLMPRASVLLATLMTSLLSSPNQRVKLADSPPTPYAIWAARVNSRVAEWYRTYNREGRNAVKGKQKLIHFFGV